MTKDGMIDRLLSALESWSLSTRKLLPGYLMDRLQNALPDAK